MTLREQILAKAKDPRIMAEARKSVERILPYLAEQKKDVNRRFCLLRLPIKRNLALEYALKAVLAEYKYSMEWMHKYHKISW